MDPTESEEAAAIRMMLELGIAPREVSTLAMDARRRGLDNGTSVDAVIYDEAQA